MSEDRIFVELSEDLARDAVGSGLARREIRRRSSVEIALTLLGTTGSLISLLQTKKTIRDFCQWISEITRKRGEDLTLRIATNRDGKIDLTVKPGTDADAVSRLLSDALRDPKRSP